MPVAHIGSQSLQFYEFGLDDVTDDVTWYKLGDLYQDLNGPCAWNCFCFCFLPQNAAKQKFRDNSKNWISGATFNIHVALAIVSGFSLGSSLPPSFETRPLTELRAHQLARFTVHQAPEVLPFQPPRTGDYRCGACYHSWLSLSLYWVLGVQSQPSCLPRASTFLTRVITPAPFELSISTCALGHSWDEESEGFFCISWTPWLP